MVLKGQGFFFQFSLWEGVDERIDLDYWVIWLCHITAYRITDCYLCVFLSVDVIFGTQK